MTQLANPGTVTRKKRKEQVIEAVNKTVRLYANKVSRSERDLFRLYSYACILGSVIILLAPNTEDAVAFAFSLILFLANLLSYNAMTWHHRRKLKNESWRFMYLISAAFLMFYALMRVLMEVITWMVGT